MLERLVGVRRGMGVTRSIAALVIVIAGLWSPQSIAALPSLVPPGLIGATEVDMNLLRGRSFAPVGVLNVSMANILRLPAARRDTPPAEACDIDALRLKLAILEAMLDSTKNELLLQQTEGAIIDATIRALSRTLFTLDLQLGDPSYKGNKDILRPIRTNYADLLDQARAKRRDIQRAEEKLEDKIDQISADMAPIEVQIRRCEAH